MLYVENYILFYKWKIGLSRFNSFVQIFFRKSLPVSEAKITVLKNINISFILNFYLDRYSFSLDTFCVNPWSPTPSQRNFIYQKRRRFHRFFWKDKIIHYRCIYRLAKWIFFWHEVLVENLLFWWEGIWQSYNLIKGKVDMFYFLFWQIVYALENGVKRKLEGRIQTKASAVKNSE